MFTIGEQRYSSAGNVFRLERIDDGRYPRIRRIGIVGQPGRELWDSDVLYRWLPEQWEELPLVGERSDDPSFGSFLRGSEGAASWEIWPSKGGASC